MVCQLCVSYSCVSILCGEIWYLKCASQKKQNDTLNTVAMTTVLPLVLS